MRRTHERAVSPDVVLLVVEWKFRALLRAQLIEEGFAVIATDTWSVTRRCLRPGFQPRSVIVDLKGLPDPETVLNELKLLIQPDQVLALGAVGTLTAEQVQHLGFQFLARPTTIGAIVAAAKRPR